MEKLDREEGFLIYENERKRKKAEYNRKNEIFYAKKHKERVERISSLVRSEFAFKGINDEELLEKTIQLRVDEDEKKFRAKIIAFKVRYKLMEIPDDYVEESEEYEAS